MPSPKKLEIDNKLIGFDEPTYFIADIAANHDGDINRAKELIYLAKESGADAAKFQHFSAKTIVSDKGFKDLGGQQSHQASWEKSVYDVYDAASVSLDWTQSLKEACDDAEITFFTSPYAFDLVDHIDDFVPAYKIGSGDITWIEMVQYIAKKNKPYIIATGASSEEDVTRAVDAAITINDQLCLMQCNTNYTASLKNFSYLQLNVLKRYQGLYPSILLGLSDHTPGHTSVLGAVTLGARMIEKHFTDNTSREGPDHKFSMDPSSWSDMVARTRELEYSLGNTIKKVEDNEKETVVLQRRAIRATRNILSGSTLHEDDLEVLRPCPKHAIQPYDLKKLIGKKVNRNIDEGDHLEWKDII